MTNASTPLYQVRSDGSIRGLGHWHSNERVLALTELGYPLLGVGRHSIEGDLPWLFWDMCPSGFLGHRFARVEHHLSLGSDPRTWSAPEAMRALTGAGEDLSGNLLIGDESLRRWHQWREEAKTWPPQAMAASSNWATPNLEEMISSERSGSSLGGQRPKWAVTDGASGIGKLVKFSPPLQSEFGQRWSDLLHCEAHCADTLRTMGISAVVARPLRDQAMNRTLLLVDRFDRLPGWGRRGAATLYWYAMETLGDVREPAPRVVRQLETAGHLTPGSAELVEKVHAFSAALGNTDTHLGNYGLVFDDQGHAELAPFFDILPMAFAPLHDELPDQTLRPLTPPTTEPIRRWLIELAGRIEADDLISPQFRDRWRHHTGLS